MKTLTKSLILILTISAGTAFSPAFAAKMDSETQNMVIERLEDIIGGMDHGDSSWTPSNIRLADLLSERARLRFMNEVEAGCKGCKGSPEDRKQALKIYASVVSETKGEQKGLILFQMAHLHELANDSSKAMAVYEQILKAKSGVYPAEVVTKSRVALGDLYFQRGDSKKAEAIYQNALKDKNLSQKGITQYRLAWCEYNLGHFKTAIRLLEDVAGNPALLATDSTEGPKLDPVFQSDVLHDLMTFYAQDQVTAPRIRKFLAMVPAASKKDMTWTFAQEADRLGQKQAAAVLYQIYLQDPSLTKQERLNASLAIVKTNYDEGKSKASVDAFAATAASYQKNCTDEAKCKELQKQMRRFVTELHKLKISKVDNELLRAYGIYTQTFPNDVEMAILGAQVAVDLKQDAKANELYATAADHAGTAKLREMALLGEVEAAENSGNASLREKSYRHYLQYIPQGEKAFEVRYQLAHLAYDQKQWAAAGDQFRSLALDKSGEASLRKQSADLALDSLAVQKRDADIEVWSLDFAKALPKNAADYRKIYRTSINAQVVKAANDSKASSSELTSAIQKSQAADLRGASDQEKIRHDHNLMILASRAGDDAVWMAASSALLSIHSLPAGDREATLAEQVGFAEKKLDFKSAYHTALKMKFTGQKTAQKELKLGTLADLAGLRALSQSHYRKALAAKLSGASALSVRQRLVMLSSHPATELRRQTPNMMSSPKTVTETALLIYARTHNARELGFVLKNRRLQSQPAVRFINKQPYYATHARLDQKLAAMKLDTRSERRMTKSITARLKVLKEADQSLGEANKLRDFTAQVMALSTIQRENERLSYELMGTPAPKGLNARELARYTDMLKRSTFPYLKKARLAQMKTQALWNQKYEWQNILRDYAKARFEVQGLIAQEIQILMKLAPSDEIRSLMSNTLEQNRATQHDLLSARDAVSVHPDDAAQIENLINLETKLGHPLMASYLERRLGQIHKEKSL
jgi:hypothetical protein